MEKKYIGMELELHRHGIWIALASVFEVMLAATRLVAVIRRCCWSRAVGLNVIFVIKREAVLVKFFLQLFVY